MYITNSENTAYITGGETMEEGRAHAGGIVGRLYADGTALTDPKIANCFNSGQIMSSGQPGCAGGIMGYCLDTDVYCCVNTGVICGTNLGYDDPRDWCADMFGAICGAEGGSFHNGVTYHSWTGTSDDDSLTLGI